MAVWVCRRDGLGLRSFCTEKQGVGDWMWKLCSFRAGYAHTITVTLNTSPDQEKIEISIDPDVETWN